MGGAKPSVCAPPLWESIPPELQARPQWVEWRWFLKPNGEFTKPPLQPDGTKAKTSDPSTWCSFEYAQTALETSLLADSPHRFDGIGFILTENDEFTGWDFDNCLDADFNITTPQVSEYVTSLNSYTEISPSLTGLRVITRGKLPAGRRKKGDFECYDSGRYLTITGRTWPPASAPKPIVDCQPQIEAVFMAIFASNGAAREAALSDSDLLTRARNAKNGARFVALYDNGDGRETNESDQALCDLLAFWTNRESARIDSLFRGSALYRDKWERRDYREKTINAAIARCTEGYVPRAKSRAVTFDEPPSQSKGVAVTVKVSDIEEKDLKWLWYERFAFGKFNIIAGDPDRGKSFVTLDVTTRVTRGWDFPDGAHCEVGRVLLCTSEDSFADTIKPRLRAQGANLELVERLTMEDEHGKPRYLNLETDLPAIEAKLKELGDVKLIIFDPFTAYLGDIDSNKDPQVRALLTPLVEMAERMGVAIIGIFHLNKAATLDIIYRVQGSVGFVGQARGTWCVLDDPDVPERRLMLKIKNNLARKDISGLAFTIREVDGRPKLEWEPDPILVDIRQVIGGFQNIKRRGPKGEKLERATKLIDEMLADGARPMRDVETCAHAARISTSTLRDAANKRGVVPKKDEQYQGKVWWSLPPDAPEEGEGAWRKTIKEAVFTYALKQPEWFTSAQIDLAKLVKAETGEPYGLRDIQWVLRSLVEDGKLGYRHSEVEVNSRGKPPYEYRVKVGSPVPLPVQPGLPQIR